MKPGGVIPAHRRYWKIVGADVHACRTDGHGDVCPVIDHDGYRERNHGARATSAKERASTCFRRTWIMVAPPRVAANARAVIPSRPSRMSSVIAMSRHARTASVISLPGRPEVCAICTGGDGG